ncbi:MAG: hypothetical protein ACRC33_21030 [Gemmataceae bacterium]
MRYHCTLFTQTFSATRQTFAGTEPSFDAPVVSVTVRGDSLRLAAARAYVRCVGRERAKRLAELPHVRPEVAALDASPRAVAAGLRKTHGRIGEVFELDNANESWFIKVVPMTPRPRRARVHSRLLYLSSLSPSPN